MIDISGCGLLMIVELVTFVIDMSGCGLFAGLVTFGDGSNGMPRQEGKFDCGKLVEQCDCSSELNKARDAAASARNM